jgi:alanine racemase
MDIVMIDIMDIKNVKVGDEVVILGNGKNGPIVDEIVGPIDASAYEFVTRINPLIKRFY